MCDHGAIAIAATMTPDEDGSGHEIHKQALEALSACCHDCRYGQKAPSDNKGDKGFQCEHQRPALNCPKKIRGVGWHNSPLPGPFFPSCGHCGAVNAV